MDWSPSCHTQTICRNTTLSHVKIEKAATMHSSWFILLFFQLLYVGHTCIIAFRISSVFLITFRDCSHMRLTKLLLWKAWWIDFQMVFLSGLLITCFSPQNASPLHSNRILQGVCVVALFIWIGHIGQQYRWLKVTSSFIFATECVHGCCMALFRWSLEGTVKLQPDRLTAAWQLLWTSP